MLIYVAGPWVHRAQVKQVAQQYRDKGHTVVSRWHDDWGARSDAGITDADKREEAEKDVADVQMSQALVLLNWEGSTGGMFVEQGIAIDRHTPVIVVGGPRSNVFHHLLSVKYVNSFAESLGVLAELEDYL